MPKVDVLDAKGHPLKVEFLDGLFFPRPPLAHDLQSHLDLIHDLELRDDDVFICAYPKCGTHWVWEMVQMLRQGEVKYDARSKETMMIDFMPKETLDDLPSPRTLNSHFFFRHLPKEIEKCRNKIILINRDPRDACVSMYSHVTGLKEIAQYEGEFVDFVPLFVEGAVLYDSWFLYTKDWDRVQKEYPALPVLTLYYEEMKKDPVRAVKQLAEFLEVKANDELCAAIADACDFDKLRAAHHSEKEDPLKHTWKDGHVGIYRKGKTGDWRNWFTVANSEKFDACFAKHMVGSSVYDRYKSGTS